MLKIILLFVWESRGKDMGWLWRGGEGMKGGVPHLVCEIVLEGRREEYIWVTFICFESCIGGEWVGNLFKISKFLQCLFQMHFLSSNVYKILVQRRKINPQASGRLLSPSLSSSLFPCPSKHANKHILSLGWSTH